MRESSAKLKTADLQPKLNTLCLGSVLESSDPVHSQQPYLYSARHPIPSGARSLQPIKACQGLQFKCLSSVLEP